MISVRTLDGGALPQLRALQQRCFDEFWSEPHWRAQIEQPRNRLLGIDCDAQLVGYALFSTVLDEAELLQIAIDPAWRRQGLAQRLLQQAQTELAAAGIVRLLLEVRLSNQPAVQLYRRLGFSEDGRRRDYYPTATGREDALLMSCPLAE